jgi:hypothetical protein
MNLLLVCLLAVFVLGLRSGSRRPDVRSAVPVFIGCCIVAVAYLSQRFL